MSYTNGLDKPTDYFNTVLYTGNGGTQSITVGFKPDLVWGKSRSGSGYHHNLVDSVRGNTKYLESDRTNAENTLNDAVTSFTSDGFTLGADAGDREFNENNNSMVAWNWLASNTTASNTDGSITSTVSANTTSGFSIVKWTGTGSPGTIGHGLNAEAKVIIVKKLNSVEQWFSYHKPLGNTGALVLNTTAAKINDAGYWNSTTPTSSVFSVTSNGSNNASGDTYIAYCFADVKGYSKVGGSYTGNGSTDGTFVYTGFKPAFTIIKRTDTTNDWMVGDNKINPFNVTDNMLRANLNNAQQSGNYVDYLSNGFKPRLSGNAFNGSGGTYIYMAFAENPFVTSTGIPSCAR